MKRLSKGSFVSVILPVILIMVLFVLLGVYIFNKYSAALQDGESFKAFLDSYGSLSALVFILFQVIQVVIAFIPGEVVQIAGGYAFGTFFGTLYSIIGTTLGAVIAFFLARRFGNPLVNLFAKPEKVEKFRSLIDSKNGYLITFLIFLIPGIPKDLMIYVAGITPIRPLYFFIIYTVARIPGNMGSSYMGSSLGVGNFKGFIIILIIALILLIFGAIYNDKIMGWLNKIKSKK